MESVIARNDIGIPYVNQAGFSTSRSTNYTPAAGSNNEIRSGKFGKLGQDPLQLLLVEDILVFHFVVDHLVIVLEVTA